MILSANGRKLVMQAGLFEKFLRMTNDENDFNGEAKCMSANAAGAISKSDWCQNILRGQQKYMKHSWIHNLTMSFVSLKAENFDLF